MRNTSDPNALICTFICDEDGGCLVDTPDGAMNTKNMRGNKPFYLEDGREIFYPSWCDW